VVSYSCRVGLLLLSSSSSPLVEWVRVAGFGVGLASWSVLWLVLCLVVICLFLLVGLVVVVEESESGGDFSSLSDVVGAEGHVVSYPCNRVVDRRMFSSMSLVRCFFDRPGLLCLCTVRKSLWRLSRYLVRAWSASGSTVLSWCWASRLQATMYRCDGSGCVVVPSKLWADVSLCLTCVRKL